MLEVKKIKLINEMKEIIKDCEEFEVDGIELDEFDCEQLKVIASYLISTNQDLEYQIKNLSALNLN